MRTSEYPSQKYPRILVPSRDPSVGAEGKEPTPRAERSSLASRLAHWATSADRRRALRF